MAQSESSRRRSRIIFQTPELKDKIVFTLLCLLIYRIGAHVTAPGIDVRALIDFFQNQRRRAGCSGLYDLFTGGGLSRATVFALGIMPYISASIFLQIARAVIPTVEKMQKDEEGRKQDHAVDALRHGGARGGAGVGLRALHRVAAGRGGRIRASASACRWRSSSPRARCSSCGWASRSPSAASATAPA